MQSSFICWKYGKHNKLSHGVDKKLVLYIAKFRLKLESQREIVEQEIFGYKNNRADEMLRTLYKPL